MLAPLVLLLALAVWFVSLFVHPAPPGSITITGGPPGSAFASMAEQYRRILARQGVKLNVLPSEGSLENLKRLADPKAKVDIGFVQGGLAGQAGTSELYSLGSVSYTPLFVFYRAPKPIARLSELSGKRIAVAREGSGTHVLAMALLRANGIDGKDATRLVELEGTAAEDALRDKKADAAFLTGDSAVFANVLDLIRSDGVRLFDFKQADAYLLRFRYLSKLEIPAGAFDLGKNLPAEPLTLLSSTVELVARGDLHPALSDLLIEAAREVHGRSTLFQKAGEFPAPLEREYRISDDATRFYTTGKTFAYRHLPFWVASLVDRAIVLLVPLAVILIPGLRILPAFYRWRITQRIYRRYADLMELERAAFSETTPGQRTDLLRRLDKIEERVITLKLPGSFADRVYLLRSHINFVRAHLTQSG